MKPIAKLLNTPLRGSAGLARKGRAYEYLENGGTPKTFDDQVAMRAVLPNWQRIHRAKERQ